MATRFYFPLDTDSDVDPAFGTWGSTTQAVRRKMVTTKGASAITAGTTITGVSASGAALDRQYVSDPMAAGIVLDGATYKGQLLAREFDASDNITAMSISLRVFSQDGSTERHVLAEGSPGTSTELLESGFRNKTFANGDTVVGSYTTVSGDRLVLEVGFNDNPISPGTTPEAAAKYGEDATDLPENETQTTDGAGWFEISVDITFGAASAAVTGTATDTIDEQDVRDGGKTIIITLTDATWLPA